MSPSRQLGEGCHWCPPQPPTFTSLLHEAKEVIQELLPFWVLVQFVELGVGERGVSAASIQGHVRQRRAVPGSGPCLGQDPASPLAPLACSASNERLSLPHRQHPPAHHPCQQCWALPMPGGWCWLATHHWLFCSFAAEMLYLCLSFPALLLTSQRDDSVLAREDDANVDSAAANPRPSGKSLGLGCSALLWLSSLLALPSASIHQVPAWDQHPHLQGHASMHAGEMPVPSRGRAKWRATVLGAGKGAVSTGAVPLNQGDGAINSLISTA